MFSCPILALVAFPSRPAPPEHLNMTPAVFLWPTSMLHHEILQYFSMRFASTFVVLPNLMMLLQAEGGPEADCHQCHAGC